MQKKLFHLLSFDSLTSRILTHNSKYELLGLNIRQLDAVAQVTRNTACQILGLFLKLH